MNTMARDSDIHSQNLPLPAALIAFAKGNIQSFFNSPIPRYTTALPSSHPEHVRETRLLDRANNALSSIAWFWGVSPPGPDGLTLVECCEMLRLPIDVVRQRVVDEFRAGPPQHLLFLKGLIHDCDSPARV